MSVEQLKGLGSAIAAGLLPGTIEELVNVLKTKELSAVERDFLMKLLRSLDPENPLLKETSAQDR